MCQMERRPTPYVLDREEANLFMLLDGKEDNCLCIRWRGGQLFMLLDGEEAKFLCIRWRGGQLVYVVRWRRGQLFTYQMERRPTCLCC